MKQPEWIGPILRCVVCGESIPLYHGPRLPVPRMVTFDNESGHMEVHHCGLSWQERTVMLDRFMECTCGRDVVQTRDGTMLNWDGAPHMCHAPEPETGEGTIEVEPRGVLGWERQSCAGK